MIALSAKTHFAMTLEVRRVALSGDWRGGIHLRPAGSGSIALDGNLAQVVGLLNEFRLKWIVLGSAARMTHPFMTAVADGLAERNIATSAFESIKSG